MAKFWSTDAPEIRVALPHCQTPTDGGGPGGKKPASKASKRRPKRRAATASTASAAAAGSGPCGVERVRTLAAAVLAQLAAYDTQPGAQDRSDQGAGARSHRARTGGAGLDRASTLLREGDPDYSVNQLARRLAQIFGPRPDASVGAAAVGAAAPMPAFHSEEADGIAVELVVSAGELREAGASKAIKKRFAPLNVSS